MFFKLKRLNTLENETVVPLSILDSRDIRKFPLSSSWTRVREIFAAVDEERSITKEKQRKLVFEALEAMTFRS